MAFELPPLPYDYSALEPYIDTQTMHLHHDKHHAAYVTNLNNAVHNTAFASMSVDDLVRQISKVPDNICTTVQNNAGGHANHSLFWQIIKPNGGGQPTVELASAIQQAFGSFDQFRVAFNDTGVKRFGSGWVWLVLDPGDKRSVTSTANQDSPLMTRLLPRVPEPPPRLSRRVVECRQLGRNCQVIRPGAQELEQNHRRLEGHEQ